MKPAASTRIAGSRGSIVASSEMGQGAVGSVGAAGMVPAIGGDVALHQLAVRPYRPLFVSLTQFLTLVNGSVVGVV